MPLFHDQTEIKDSYEHTLTLTHTCTHSMYFLQYFFFKSNIHNSNHGEDGATATILFYPVRYYRDFNKIGLFFFTWEGIPGQSLHQDHPSSTKMCASMFTISRSWRMNLTAEKLQCPSYLGLCCRLLVEVGVTRVSAATGTFTSICT